MSFRGLLRPSSTLGMMVLLLIAATAQLFADSTSTTQRTVTRLAEGIYEIRHPDAPDTFPQSNTTVIVGAKAVLVVDSCLLPSSAREDIEQIRQWTNKPVTYLLNTHWHFDHTLGNRTYAEAFPSIQIVAQKNTQKVIADFNPGAMERYPARAQRFQKILDAGKDADGKVLTPGDRKDYEKSLAGLGPVVAEFKTTSQLVPNVSFEKELNIDLGDRPVEIRFVGRGNTAGDAVVYLPNDKILITGDLVDHPVPYLFGGFPLDQVNTLQALTQFDAKVIVPGHGDVLHDMSYIQQMIDFLKAVNTAIEKEVNGGKTAEEVKDSFPKIFDVKAWKEKFAGASVEDGEFFDGSFEGLIKASYAQTKMR